MAKGMKKKESYGGCTIDHFSPERSEGWPKAINVVLGFEEALKLQLAIQARLMEINGLNRSASSRHAARPARAKPQPSTCAFTPRAV